MKTKGGIIEAAMKYRQIVILIVSLMFEFSPKFIFIGYIVVQLDKNDRHAISTE